MSSHTSVTIVDYGMANLLNVARAFQHIGADVKVTEDPADASGAQRLVVPGVGAFEHTIDELVSRGFGDVVKRYAETGRPFLGICVGMQMLFDASEEFGEHKGLGIFPGRVKAVPSTTLTGEKQRVPHIGWNYLVRPENGREWSGTLLQPVATGSPSVYFVHSFAAVPKTDSDRLADCIYGGHRLCAAVQRGNVMATQFHPERSGEMGLNLLRSFLAL